jgi:hypothetical protein
MDYEIKEFLIFVIAAETGWSFFKLINYYYTVVWKYENHSISL